MSWLPTARAYRAIWASKKNAPFPFDTPPPPSLMFPRQMLMPRQPQQLLQRMHVIPRAGLIEQTPSLPTTYFVPTCLLSCLPAYPPAASLTKPHRVGIARQKVARTTRTYVRTYRHSSELARRGIIIPRSAKASTHIRANY